MKSMRRGDGLEIIKYTHRNFTLLFSYPNKIPCKVVATSFHTDFIRNVYFKF